MRTKTYESIVELMSDGEWHNVEELWKVTAYPADWLKELSRDRRFEYDLTGERLRLIEVPQA